MAEWKSTHGVTDEGAYRAGVYGTPNSTWDIARAQQETQRAQQERSGYGAAPSYQPPVFTPHVYTPSPVGMSDYSEAGGCLAMFKALALVVLRGVGVLALANAGALWVMFGPQVDAMMGKAPALSTAHYLALSPEAAKLSSTPSSRLYAARLKGTAPDWSTLSPPQRHAVQAAWIRYTRDPASFARLSAPQRAYFGAAFESYLRQLDAAGDPHAQRDLGQLGVLRR